MDLESGCSSLESREDDEVRTPGKLVNSSDDTTKIANNGSCVVVDDKLVENAKGKGIEVTELVNSPPTIASPLGTAMKGYGLKKWRRIRREVNTDGSINVDSSKILKRGLSNTAAKSIKISHFSADVKQKSAGSISSTNAMVRSPGAVVDGFIMIGDPGSAVGPTFNAREDSESSEDRSSRSSTAASAPKMRCEKPAGARDKNRRSLSGKNMANSVQRSQQGKGQIETSKKPRGELIKIEKENSHSSMESDSRSSNFVFMQGTDSVTSNGRQSGMPMNYDGENSDEAQGCDQQFSEEFQIGNGRKEMGEFEEVFQENLGVDLSWEAKEEKSENQRSSSDKDSLVESILSLQSVQDALEKGGKEMGEFEEVFQENLGVDLSWEAKEEKSENQRSSSDKDSLVESILSLQSVQDALEKEVQKLKDIGKEDISVFNGSSSPSKFPYDDPEVHEQSSSDPLLCDESGQSASHPFETQLVSLKRSVNSLESKLAEARVMLQMKEAKITELEATLGRSMSAKEESGSTVGLQQEKYRGVETELEGLFSQKIESEVQYLAISRTVQNLRVAAVDQITLLEEQKTLALEQAQMLNKLGYVEGKAAMLKREAEKLETYCEDIVAADDVLRLQKKICKFTWCFFIQLMLLVVILALFVFKLSPLNAGVVVPT
ncbi:unnamed protein product [Ilex paraguariensis]|uniref:WPP domain-interacting protein 1 n=1 Tax=Ilex paraguariensis TaxID=185542 RepID=A0ABC8UI71_9AQUA